MGRITLPRKISKWSIVKLFTLAILVVTGYYFYPTLNNPNTSNLENEVLATTSSGPIIPQKISNYFHKNNIRENCSSLQPNFNTSCVTSTGQNVPMPEKVYFVNPIIDEILNEPVVFFLGGVYQVNISENPNVSLVSRLYNSVNGKYTTSCMTGYSPPRILNAGSGVVLWGSQGRQYDEFYRCMNNLSGYSVENCNNLANDWNIPRYEFYPDWYPSVSLRGKKCIPSNLNYCFDREFDCKMLNGDTQYWNTSHLYRVDFTKSLTSNALTMKLDRAVRSKDHEGYEVGDADVYCFGKKRNGECSNGLLALPLRNQNLALRLRITDVPNEANEVFYPSLNALTYGNYIRDSWKTFYSRNYSGLTREKQFVIDAESKNFAGLDTPLDSFNLSSRIDYLQISQSPIKQDTDNFIDKRRIDYITGKATAYPQEFQLKTNFVPNYYASNVLSDFATNRYFISVRVGNGFLYVTRYKPTGMAANNYTINNSISLPVTFNWINATTRPNITFGITSNDDIDILVAPHYAQMYSGRDVPSRVFRASMFNKPTNQAYGPLIELTNLVSKPDGYKFENHAPGINYPISMKYFKTEDTDSTNDYAVFVSKNYVFVSDIPGFDSTKECSLFKNNTVSVVNTNPNSVNFGIPVKSDLAGDPYLYDLNFAFTNPLTLSCPTGIVNIPEGTRIGLTLYDGITQVPLAETLSASLLADRKSFKFIDEELGYFKKYYYKVNFVYNGSTYILPSTGVDTGKYFTLESYLNLKVYLDTETSIELPDSKMVITKTFKNNQRQYILSSPAGDYQFTLISQYFPNFFWDHEMTKVGATLNDEVGYRVCFTNTPDTKISRIGFTGLTTTSTTSLSNNYFTGTINNGCLDLNYKTNTIASYNLVPQSIDIYLTTSNTPTITSKVNFRVNGNTMIKNTSDIKIFSTTEIDKKYQGSYIASAILSDKGYALSLSNKNQFFRIPYYSKLTNAYNFSWTQDLVLFTEPTTMISSETRGILLTDNKADVSSNSYDKIDAFATYVSAKPSIIYVAKNKYLYFDLTNTNITNYTLENTYFVSTDKSNTQERIVFNIDCDKPDYSFICSQNYEYHMKGGLYGDFKLIGNRNARTENKAFITIHQNPEILILLQKDLRTNKLFNVTRSKTIFKYLNN